MEKVLTTNFKYVQFCDRQQICRHEKTHGHMDAWMLSAEILDGLGNFILAAMKFFSYMLLKVK